MKPQSISAHSGKYCQACGHLNPSWRSECEQCQTRLPSADAQPISVHSGKYCSACGHLNAAWRSECEQCQTKLTLPKRSTYYERERPGCVTAYAILIGVVASLVAIGGFVSGLNLMASEGRNSGLAGLLVIIIAGGVAGLEFLIARGLWQLKNWARILVIVLQSLSILTSLISLCVSLSGSSDYSGIRIAGTIIGIGINVYIIYWFAGNSEYFQ